MRFLWERLNRLLTIKSIITLVLTAVLDVYKRQSQSLADDTDWYIYNLAGWAVAINISKAIIGYTQEDSDEQIKSKFKAWLAAQHAAGTPVTVYYELAEPVITQHTPTAIPAIYPTTTVYSDQGNISVSYNQDSNQVYGDLSGTLSNNCLLYTSRCV